MVWRGFAEFARKLILRGQFGGIGFARQELDARIGERTEEAFEVAGQAGGFLLRRKRLRGARRAWEG